MLKTQEGEIIRKIEDALIDYYGEKCPDYEKGCIICEVWKGWEELKGRQEQKKEELKFLEALKLWRSWKRMSEFAQANINNRIEELKQKIKGEK